MIPSGIWSRANAKLKSDTAPVPSRLAIAVTTMNVIWVTPSPMARGAIRTSALRACGSASSMRGSYRKPSRASGRTWTSRWASEPATTLTARPSTPNLGPRMSAPPMIARL